MKVLNNVFVRFKKAEANKNRKAAAIAFKAANKWCKPNLIPQKGEYILAQFNDERYEFVTRKGLNPWLALGGYPASGQIVRVLRMNDIPADLWGESGDIKHPVENKWISISDIS